MHPCLVCCTPTQFLHLTILLFKIKTHYISPNFCHYPFKHVYLFLPSSNMFLSLHVTLIMTCLSPSCVTILYDARLFYGCKIQAGYLDFFFYPPHCNPLASQTHFSLATPLHKFPLASLCKIKVTPAATMRKECGSIRCNPTTARKVCHCRSSPNMST